MYADTGSPEVQLLLAIPPEGIPRKELQANTILCIEKCFGKFRAFRLCIVVRSFNGGFLEIGI